MTRNNPTLPSAKERSRQLPGRDFVGSAISSEMNAAYTTPAMPNTDLSDVDFLTCGSCQREFLLSEIVQFMKHKKVDCRDENRNPGTAADLYQRLMCQIKDCQQKFSTAWGLLQHVQNSHALNIFFLAASGVYSQGIETIQVQPQQGPGSTTLDVSSLCMLGLGDSFQDLQMAPEPRHAETQTEADADEDCSDHCSPEVCAGRKCCDTQNCCITIMPGTHERPRKCCSSVVPKKRKQHMEQHNKVGAVTRSQRRRRSSESAMRDAIFIDFGPSQQPERDSNSSVSETQFASNYVQVEGTNMFLRNTQNMTVSVGPQEEQKNQFTLTDSFQSFLLQDAPTSLTASLGADGRGGEVMKAAEPVEGDGKKRRYPTSRPFKCDHCGMSFNQRIHLKKHLSKHTGIKPFKCQQCNYSTVERSHLKVHIRIHTGEKPYKCMFCEYATAQNSTLKIHVKRHHSGMTLSCTICGKSFSQPTQLNKHTQEHQPQQHQQAAVPGAMP